MSLRKIRGVLKCMQCHNSDVDLDKLAEEIVKNAIETSKSIDDDILYKKKGHWQSSLTLDAEGLWELRMHLSGLLLFLPEESRPMTIEESLEQYSRLQAQHLELFKQPMVAMLKTVTMVVSLQIFDATMEFFKHSKRVDLPYWAAISWR